MTRFVVVPQWQGSASSRAMQLIDGAHAIAGDLPRASTTVLDVPLSAGESLGSGVQRLSALLSIRTLVHLELAVHEQPLLLVGGDCGVSVGAIAHVLAQDADTAVVWLDAHPDLHSPDTSPSGAFGGMALRAVLGDGPEGLALTPGAVTPASVVLAGARSFDDAEAEYVEQQGISALTAADLSEPGALAAAVRATGARRVFVHIDLDVLDPSQISGVTTSQPFGASVADVVASIAALRAEMPLAGSAITGFSPSSPGAAIDDLGAVLRLIGALA